MTSLLLRALCSSAFLAVLPAAAQPAGPLAGFGWFAELAGACWKGEHPGGRTSDVQCYETQYGRLIRGTIRITAKEGAAPAFEGDSVFAPGGSPDRVHYAQWGSRGTFAVGEMTIEGDVLRFRTHTRDGKEAPVRFSWRRVDKDRFRVTPEREEGGGWVEGESVTYRRVASR